ncbi:MAG TPA: hypothetical protein VMU66_00180 [Gaiellales bacterium]|nr:hypothetical protein [Gaiellales bacterium]
MIASSASTQTSPLNIAARARRGTRRQRFSVKPRGRPSSGVNMTRASKSGVSGAPTASSSVGVLCAVRASS